jgi:hypothetical protein
MNHPAGAAVPAGRVTIRMGEAGVNLGCREPVGGSVVIGHREAVWHPSGMRCILGLAFQGWRPFGAYPWLPSGIPPGCSRWRCGAPPGCGFVLQGAPVRTSTSFKLAIVGIVALLFSGFILRAALRLANTAMHSMFTLLLVVIIVAWVTVKVRR